MPTYKLTYFPITALGELSRWIFAVAKQPYEDERITFADWPALKPNTPFGQLPLLTIDGKDQLCQSKVIAGYLANQFNLAGSNCYEHAKCAMIAQCCDDATKPLFALRGENDDTKKAEIKKKFTEEQLPGFLASFEKMLVANGGGDKYFVGCSLTWADLAVVNFLANPKDLFDIDVCLDNYPKLKSLKCRVEGDPGLAEWLKTRPANVFPPQK